MNAKTSNKALVPVLLAAFLDMIGVGIIMPVLAPLLMENQTGLFGPESSESIRAIIYGLLIGSYPLAQFFGAPILGALSDRYGRKPTLAISIFGTSIGFFLFAVGIKMQSIELMFVSRILDGFTGGNMSIVYSTVSDLSTKENRAANYGLIGMAFGLGFILGPFLGGILANPEYVSFFGPETPFIGAGIFALLNVMLIVFVMPETLKEKRIVPASPFMGFRNISKAMSYKKLRLLLIIVFLTSLGFTFFTQFFSVYLNQKFSYQQEDIGFLYGWIGIWIALTQGILVRYLSRRYSSTQIMVVSILGLGLVIPFNLVPQEAFFLYLTAPFVALFQGVTSPNSSALVSEQAGPERQGEIMGINFSIISLSHAIPPIVAGFLSNINQSLPTLAAGFFILLSWFLFTFLFLRRNTQTATN